MKFTQESIELAFKDLGIEYPIDSFISELTKIRKMETKIGPRKYNRSLCFPTWMKLMCLIL